MFNAFQPQTQPLTGIFKKLHIGFKYAALLFFAISLWTVLSSCFLLYKADRVTGRVVDIISHTSTSRKSGSSSTSYTPVFEYRYNGELLRHEANFGSGVFTYSINDEVEMLINPTSGTVKANTFLELWFLPFMLACVGGFFTLFAVAIQKFARVFQGAFSFSGFGGKGFDQAFKDIKPGSTEEIIIIKYKDGKREI